MATRDSKDNLRKYMPDLSTILRETDPAHAEKKLRDALDNPELDEALAEAKTREKNERSSSYEVPVVVVGSPPAKKAAQPRAQVAPPAGRRRGLAVWGVYMLAALAAIVPAGLVILLMKTPPPAAEVIPASGASAESASGASRQPSVPAASDAGVDARGEREAGEDVDVREGVSAPSTTAAPATEKKQLRDPTRGGARDPGAFGKPGSEPVPSVRDGGGAREPSPAQTSPPDEAETEVMH